MKSDRPPQPVPPQVVGQFLEEIGYDGAVTPEILSRYVPLVRRAGKPRLPRWRPAVNMTRRNDDLTPPSTSDFENERNRRTELAAQRREHLASFVDDDVAVAAAAYVDQVWADTGAGPTWRELGRHVGWTSAQTNGCVWELRRRGVLDYTTEHRSLGEMQPRLTTAPRSLARCA